MVALYAPHLGRCYEVAAHHFIRGGSALVHGIIRNDVGDVGHAWVELPNGDIYEPSTNDTYQVMEFLAIFRPYEFVRYTPKEALLIMHDRKDWGPWDTASLDWHDHYHDHNNGDHAQTSHAATAAVIGES